MCDTMLIFEDGHWKKPVDENLLDRMHLFEPYVGY